MKVIGHDRRMKAPAGCPPIMMGSVFTKAIGTESTAAWSTITAGTMTTTAIGAGNTTAGAVTPMAAKTGTIVIETAAITTGTTTAKRQVAADRALRE
jgi:hypothetical protein